MSSPEFQAETRATSRRARAVKQATDLLENALVGLRRAETSPFNDGADCYFCGGSGSVWWAPAHSAPCRSCNGTGKFQEDETFLTRPVGFVALETNE